MSDASTQRALRKQLLLMRAATERAEMSGAFGTARQSLSFLKSGVPNLALSKGLPLAMGLFKRAQLFSPVLSLAFSSVRGRPLLRNLMLGAGSALLAWKGYQWLTGQQAEPPADAD
ncbi:hypothetical protein [Polaromonas sp. SM01]|uniref:hypothetical protein n=1 Tax=Polaromonas sp. SM01 TaxID=3085630 RepID=UPI0029826539|nr:hypothetical protein [Polaromonas sp. SM01]MDW5443878.1 hypothetical protein [Polaromonas sp. SM01]